MDNKDIKLVERNLICKGSILNYYHDTMEFSNGNKEVWDFVEHKEVVAFVPIDIDTKKIVCVKQYRHPINKVCIEIPAGGIMPGENPLDGALREMKEETGYYCDTSEAKHLVDSYTSVGFSNEKICIYYGNVKKVSGQSLDENEFVNVELYALEELKEMIIDGKIDDGKTIAAIGTYFMKER